MPDKAEPADLNTLYHQLLDQLSEKITDRDILLLFKKPLLEARYLSKLGNAQHELFQLKMDSLKLTKEVELLKAYYTEDEISEQIRVEFEEWEAQAKIMLQNFTDSLQFIELTAGCAICEEIKDKYLEAVRKSHPEIYQRLPLPVQSLWKEFKVACEKRDFNLIFSHIRRIIESKTDIPLPSNERDLKNLTHALRHKIHDMDTQIKMIHSHFPFNVENEMETEEWVNTRINDIKSEIQDMRDQIQFFSKKRQDIINQRNRVR